MPTEPVYLLDQLETADMLEIDGLHASWFELDDELLDEADTAAEAGVPFESERIVVRIEVLLGKDRKHWAFSYNAAMEAEYDAEADSWLIEGHRLVCFAAFGADLEDE